MKQTAKLIGSLVILTCLALPVWGKGPAGVKETIHNLSTSSPYAMYESDNVDEVCVFCHTPHGGLLTGPLWNHSLPANNTFTHYNSATLSGHLSGLSVSRVVNDESLLCMGCHDGSVAVDHLINNPNSLNGDPITFFGGSSTNVEIVDLFGAVAGARIGATNATPAGRGDLSDDHPISFSYSAVLSDTMYGAGGSKDGQLRQIGTTADPNTALGWQNEGVRFFGSDARVECSSCHDPHVNYTTVANAAYTPFLIRPNAGSNLCLACHNK